MRSGYRAIGALLASCAPLWSIPALAQASETSSYGERYDSLEIYEYGAGSTTYNTNTLGEINGQTVDLGIPDGFRYFIPFTPDEIAQAVPAPYQYDIGGAVIEVVDWQEPEWVDGWYDITDSLYYTSYSFNVFDVVTVQTTSGDGPDALVPTGYVGYCSNDGTSGATNYGAFDGAFAACESAEDYFAVAPGTINTHTHATTYYVDTYYTFESIDDAFYDFYVVRPAHTRSSSHGTLTGISSTTSLARSDAFEVQISGLVEGTTLFDETLPGLASSAAVRTRIAELAAPAPYVVGNAPAVVVWSAPVPAGSNSQLVSTSTQTSTDIENYDVVTVTTTYGGMAGGQVLVGDRGACSATGASGATNGAAPDGSFAACDGGIAYTLSPGETNTNTHTTAVSLEHTETLVTENWLHTQALELNGTPVLVGPIHAAVRDTLFGQAAAFAGSQAAALAGAGPHASLWIAWDNGGGDTDADAAGPGSRRRTHGGSGGVTFSPAPGVRLGVAAGYGSTRVRLAGLPESAEVDITQVGTAAEFDLGAWLVRLSAGRGWADLETERGTAALGGISLAEYDGATWFGSVEAGPSIALGAVSLRPLAAVEWSSARLGAFAENGGIALGGEADTSTRTALAAGLEGATQWTLPGAARARFWADARANRVIDGRERQRPVHFAAMPATPLAVTSASESGTYFTLRTGGSLVLPGGLGLHLGGEVLGSARQGGWRTWLGMSAGF